MTNTLKIVGKILITIIRLIALVIVVTLWITNTLPSGKGRSDCKIARALRACALTLVKPLLPRIIANHIR